MGYGGNPSAALVRRPAHGFPPSHATPMLKDGWLKNRQPDGRSTRPGWLRIEARAPYATAAMSGLPPQHGLRSTLPQQALPGVQRRAISVMVRLPRQLRARPGRPHHGPRPHRLPVAELARPSSRLEACRSASAPRRGREPGKGPPPAPGRGSDRTQGCPMPTLRKRCLWSTEAALQNRPRLSWPQKGVHRPPA